jgi:nitrate/nitrite transporter NarK
VFTIIMFTLGIVFAIGKASVFKYISDDYPDNIGVISGVVGLAGGLGGFLMPIMFGALVDLTGIRSSAFMLMFGVVWVSLMWMYWTMRRSTSRQKEKLQIHLSKWVSNFNKKEFESWQTEEQRGAAGQKARPAIVPPTSNWGRDNAFWESEGKSIAYRNLWISVPSLLCGFAVWLMWGIITVQMLNLGFPFKPAGCLPDRHFRADSATFRIPASFFIASAAGATRSF